MVNENGKSAAVNRELDETCERYLLGELPEAAREQFEEAYFADDALFERYLAVKDELLDLYARGQLPEEKRARFAKHFQASAPRRRQANETKNFIQAITQVSAGAAAATDSSDLSASPSAAAPKSLWQSFTDFFRFRQYAWLGAAAALLFAIGGIWLFVQDRQQTTNNDLAVQRPPASPPPPPSIPSTNENSDTTVPADEAEPANHSQPPADANVAPEPTLKKPEMIPPSKNPAPKPVPANADRSPAKAALDPKPAPKKPAIKQDPARIEKLPVNERSATGFALTLSNVGRDKGPPIGPAPTSGLYVGGQRGKPKTDTGFAAQTVDNSFQQTSSIRLDPVATRDINEANTLKLRSETRFVRMTLTFKKDDYSTYSAAITTLAGETVWQDKDVFGFVDDEEKGTLGWAYLGFAADLLRQQDYIVTLYGQRADGRKETIAEYYFRVERVTDQKTPTPTPKP